MSDLITDEMVKIAARVEWHRIWPNTPWDPVVFPEWCAATRAALEAVAPMIAADTLREAAEIVAQAKFRAPVVAEWLERRSDEIEATP